MQQLLTKSSQTLDSLLVRKSHRSQLLEFVGTLSRQVELYRRLCYHQRMFSFKIHLFSTALRPSGKSTKVHTWFSYMDPISDFMASCDLSESGLIIASSYVAGSSVLSTNMTLITGSYQSGVVRVLVDLRGSVATSTEVS